MTLAFEFNFVYPKIPLIDLRIQNRSTGASKIILAMVDTGAETTILDVSVAADIGLSLENTPPIELTGIGGSATGHVQLVSLSLLDEPALTLELPVAFAPIRHLAINNLLGLDILEHFDFGLQHADRVGYLSRRS